MCNDLCSSVVLVLLPPSEGKTAPVRGRPIDLSALSSPMLTEHRRLVLDELSALCRDAPERAREVLGLGTGQADAVTRNAGLRDAPATRADRVYTGVLYAAMGLDGLDPGARRRAGRWLATTSSVFGLVRPSDRIPAYRLSGDVRLPRVGPVAAHWRRALEPAVTAAAGDGVVLDLRSTAYQAFWRPGPGLARRTAVVRVLHQLGGSRTVASHFNKATKGRLVRSLLESTAAPRTVGGLVSTLRELGWQVERDGARIDVVVDEP
jgi:cytoplasmic iron level regulating protein YaaA (DUF328/UPF0246 family)